MSEANGTSDLDAVLERIPAEHREAFLRSRMRVNKCQENDEVLAIATHLDNFAVVIGDLSSNVTLSELKDALKTSPEVESTRKELSELTEAVKALKPQGNDHLADVTQAFETLAEKVHTHTIASAQYDEKILRKLSLLITQPEQKLKRWVLWCAGGILAAIMLVMFFLGMKAEEGSANARIAEAQDLARKAVQLATDKVDSVTKKAPSGSMLVKPLPTP